MSDFVHLLVQSDATFLDSTCRVSVDKSLASSDRAPIPLTKAASDAGMRALALTDRHGMFHAPIFTQSAESEKIHPIIGCQINISPTQQLPPGAGAVDFRLLILACDDGGLRRINELATEAARNTDPMSGPIISAEALKAGTSGLIGILGGLNCEARYHLQKSNPDAATRSILELSQHFADGDFFLALQRVGAEDEENFNTFLRGVGKKNNIPLTVIHDVRYISPDDAEAHDVLRCIATNSQLENETRERLPSDQFYLKTAAEMHELFPDDQDLLASTVRIAERCQAKITFGRSLYPAYPLEKGQDAHTLLSELCYQGLRERYPKAFSGLPEVLQEEKKLTDRLDYELSVLKKTGFDAYFLIVWDFIDFARRHGIPVGPGRGSAAGSLVAYVLRITDVDPFRYGLIFERFLNPERVSPPDVDIDFCPERRADVINYVREKYGSDCVAQIITFGTLGAKVAVRDVTRVLGLGYGLGDRIAKLIPNQPIGITLTQALKNNPELAALRDSDSDVARIIDLALRIEGLNRQSGVHAAGVIISDKSLTNNVPLSRAEDGSMICQYDMNAITDIGLLKMDFLGLKTLTVIQDAEALIQANHQRTIAWNEIPDNDPSTLDLLNQGHTIGVFQLESSGMRDLCRKFQLSVIDDIIALIALYRPGPMDLIPDFVRRRHGEVEVTYEHPALEAICSDTYGIMIYQEQVMKAANVLAGYSLGGSDLLRRAMGKKDTEKMAKERIKFIEGCAKHNGIPADQAERIFNLLEKFAGYGFNKSHSAAYGVLSYRTAWLKANFTAEFMCALLSNEIGGKLEKIASFCLDAEALGIKIEPPDINKSFAQFTTDGKTIRYGLAAIKNASQTAMIALVEEREKNGPYTSLDDLTRRNDPHALNKRSLEALNKAGAFDSFDGSRLDRHEDLDRAIAAAAATHRDAARGQASLFGELEPHPHPAQKNGSGKSSGKKTVRDWSKEERLDFEREHTGLYISGHPLDAHLSVIAKFRVSTSADLAEIAPNTVVRVAGLIKEVRKITTRSGKLLLRAVLEDPTGAVEITVPPFDMDALASQLKEKSAYLIAGVVEDPGERAVERTGIRPLEVVPLDDAPRKYLRNIRLRLPAEPDWNMLDQFLRKFAGRYRTQIMLRHPTSPDFSVLLQLDDAFNLIDSQEAQETCEQLFGKGSWEYIPDPNPPLPDPPRNRYQRRQESPV